MGALKKEQLQKLISKAPATPGVYVFKGSDRKELYVGKASQLKMRLLSYLKNDDSRIRTMVQKATSLQLFPTLSEIDALILESRLIKSNRPEFNIMLRDDKQFFYIAFTRELFPKIFITHQPEKVASSMKQVASDGKEFLDTRYLIHDTGCIGPFTDGTALKTTLKYLRSVLPYCTCLQKHKVHCLNYHIGNCPGYCCLEWDITEPNTAQKIRAEEYNKNIKAIQNILLGKRKTSVLDMKRDMIRAGKNSELEKAISIQKRIEKVERIFENATIIGNWKLEIGNSEADKVRENTINELQKLLSLKNWPIRIESYDISNISGLYAVGAMAVFENGVSDRNEYRKFKIKLGRGHGDDTAMLREITARRFNHPEWRYPDLILVDGGKGQVSSIKAILKEKNLEIPVIGLVKNKKHIGEKILTPNGKEIPLRKINKNVSSLLLRLDSEAHRSAITFYRSLHRKSLL